MLRIVVMERFQSSCSIDAEYAADRGDRAVSASQRGMSVPIEQVAEVLFTDEEFVSTGKVEELRQAVADFRASSDTEDKRKLLSSVKLLVGPKKFTSALHVAKAAAAAALAVAAGGMVPAAGGQKRKEPAHTAAAGSSSSAADGAEGTGEAASDLPQPKRARGSVAQGYAAAAAEPPKEEKAKKESFNPEGHFSIVQLANIDVTQEEISLEGPADEEAGPSHALALDPTSVKAKLTQLAQRHGLEEVTDGVCGLLGLALEERLTSLLLHLRRAASIRMNQGKTLFGADAFVETSDPRLTWKKNQERQQQLKAQREAQAEAALPHRQPAGKPGRAELEDEIRMREIASDPPWRDATASGSHRMLVEARDVLYLLEQEPQSARSPLVQWWRCDGRPLKRFARHAARLFAAARPQAAPSMRPETM